VSDRVVVVGSVNVDLVIRSQRLPARGETVTGGTFERHHGGKGGNQAVAVARLGMRTAFVGAVGADGFGREAGGALADEGVDISGLRTVTEARTGVALILVDGAGENLISVASGANARVSPELVRGTLAHLGRLDGDVVLVSREIPPVSVVAALEAARTAGARTILNPAPATALDPSELGLADVVTPNRVELAACAAALPGGRVPSDIEGQARRLLDMGVGEAVVVTMGAEGALVVPAAGGPSVSVPAFPVRAVDATGAGDAFAGALAAAMVEGRPIIEAVRRAVVAAGLSTRRHGAREGMPTLAELEAAVAAD
jgi:ribokinase